MELLEQKEKIKKMWEGKIDSYLEDIESARERVRLIDDAVFLSLEDMIRVYEDGGTKVEEQELFFLGYGMQRVVYVSFGSGFVLSKSVMEEFLDYMRGRASTRMGTVSCFFGTFVSEYFD